MTTSKGGRKATGWIKWRRNGKTGRVHWHAQITMPDGSRPFVPLDPSIPEEDREGAQKCAERVSARAREIGAVPDTVRETVGEWLTRFHAHKEARALSSVDDMRSRARNWVLPTLANKDMRAVTRDDVEAIVRHLDRAILAWHAADAKRGEGRASPATAANVWGDLVHAFDEAVRSKDPSLRVLQASPCANVRGPETGITRDGPILYSDEIVTLLRGKAVDEGSRDVPLYRRRVYAVALYTMARRSELAALTSADVDLARSEIVISKQQDRKKKAGTKKTKTGRTRTIDIEPHLLPLLHVLVAQAGKGRLLRVPPPEDCAELLRRDLWAVGVRRDALHTADATRTRMEFHCLRDTGLTHMAVRGDSPIQIQWRGGHTDFKTTQGYISRGRVEGRRIGDPLPPLPPEPSDLAADQPTEAIAIVSQRGETGAPTMRESLAIRRPQRELNPKSESASESAESIGNSAESALSPPEAPPEVPLRNYVSASNSRPHASESRSFASDVAELEGRMVAAELAGRTTVADALARQIEARRAGENMGNVVALNSRRPGS